MLLLHLNLVEWLLCFTLCFVVKALSLFHFTGFIIQMVAVRFSSIKGSDRQDNAAGEALKLFS